MKKIYLLLAIATAFITLQSCEDFDDNAVPVNDFVWKGLNLFYLWKDEVPNLADDRFNNQGQLNSFLWNYSSTEDLFNSLLYSPGTIDKWSRIFPDYLVLENALQGELKSNGVDYQLVYKANSQTDIFGYVRYVLPNSDAAAKNIKRGDIFYAVDGINLNVSNYQNLLGADTYTLNLANYNDGEITPNGNSVSLTKTAIAEHPVYYTNVYNEGSNTIGYLMYNGFYSNYDTDLNAAFGQFASQNVSDLVLDLRYNSGGSVSTALHLASMVTGQFTNQLFSKQQWNKRLQEYYSSNPSALEDNFVSSLPNGTAINHLNLNKVYILTSQSSASASELLINCLEPYINVIVIGDKTAGKNVGSITLYDSPALVNKRNINNSHRYAMQPIVSKIVNKNGFGEYTEGIEPDFEIKENLENLGIIGNTDEPLFSTAIEIITGNSRRRKSIPREFLRNFKDAKSNRHFGYEMYLENAPEEAINLIKNLQ